MLLQYWFFYPFNDAFWLFDHDGDWEHVTVKLDAAMHPEGAYVARVSTHDGHADAASFAVDGAGAGAGEHPLRRRPGRGKPSREHASGTRRRSELGCAAREAEPSRAEEAGVHGRGARGPPKVNSTRWPSGSRSIAT